MRLSGHNYNNDVFNSLLDGLGDDIVLKNKTKTAQAEIKSTDIFTSVDMSKMSAVEQEQITRIAQELDYAAAQAKVELTLDDLIQFSKDKDNANLRGRNLERAARSYCKNLHRAVAEPQSIVRLSEQLKGEVSSKTVMPAYYGEGGPGDAATGKYMRSSSNPNSIWDSQALSRLAAKATEQTFGDEQMAETKAKKQAFKEKLEAEYKQSLKEKIEDPNRLNPLLQSTATTGKEASHNAKLPKAAISMFGDYSELDQIPEKTAGEQIAFNKLKEKLASLENGPPQIEGAAKKIDSSMSGLFNQNAPKMNKNRSALDSFFDSFTKAQNKE